MLLLFTGHPVAFCGMLLLDVWSCCEKFVEVQTDTICVPTLLGQQCWANNVGSCCIRLHEALRYKTKALIRLLRLLEAVFFFNESLRKLLLAEEQTYEDGNLRLMRKISLGFPRMGRRVTLLPTNGR